jgi:hypothetical protein
MTKLYKSILATEPHVVSAYKLRDFLSARESIDETGKAYSYVCQRQMEQARTARRNFLPDTSFEPFIMSDDVFTEAYDEMAE